MKLDNKKKIFVIGNSGCGKTTLAKRLSKKLKIDHYNLDDIYFEKKFTKKRSIEDCKKRLSELIRGKDLWIVEGVYTNWTDLVRDEADIIIWIECSVNLATYRVFKRYFTKGIKRGESFRDFINLIKYVRSYHDIRDKTKESKYQSFRDFLKNDSKKTIFLQGAKELKEFMYEIDEL